MIVFFMNPVGEFVLLIIVFSILLLLLRLIFWPIEKLVLRRKVITKLNRSKVFLGAIALVAISSTTITYCDYHPGKKLYADEWVKHTHFDLPEKYKIQDKYYGSPDLGGDYTTTALFIFDKTDYLILKQKIVSDTSFHQTGWIESSDLDKIMNENDISIANMRIQLSRDNSYGHCQVGLLDNQNSILFYTFSY
jgi:hypothetical protein